MTHTVESCSCNARGEGWVIDRSGHRRIKWSFPARTDVEFIYWSRMVLGAIARSTSTR